MTVSVWGDGPAPLRTERVFRDRPFSSEEIAARPPPVFSTDPRTRETILKATIGERHRSRRRAWIRDHLRRTR